MLDRFVSSFNIACIQCLEEEAGNRSEVKAGRKVGSGRRKGNIMMDFTALFRGNVATVEKMEGEGGGNLGKEQ